MDMMEFSFFSFVFFKFFTSVFSAKSVCFFFF